MIPSSMPVLQFAPAGVSSAQGTTTIAKLLPSSRRGFAPGCERRSLAWILLALCPAAWVLPCIVLLLLPLGRSISFCMHLRPCAPAGCRTSDSGLIRATAVCTSLQYYSKTARLCIMPKRPAIRPLPARLIRVRSKPLQCDFLLQNCASCTNRLIVQPAQKDPSQIWEG